MALVRNEDNELYLMRAIMAEMRNRVHALISRNSDKDRSFMVVHSPAERIGKNEYVIAIVVANLDRRTTIPYLEIMECRESDLQSTIKETLKEIISNPRNAVISAIGETDVDMKTFKNKVITQYGSIIDDSDPNIGDAFEDLKPSTPFKVMAQIVKATRDDLNEIIDDLDDDEKEDFNSVSGKYRNENLKVQKDKKMMTFGNGIQFTVVGFDYDEDDDECSYRRLDCDVSYKLKREVKSDDMYN